MKRTQPEREAMMAKARSRHTRKHPESSMIDESPDKGILSQVQGAVAGTLQAAGRAAKIAMDAVKDAVAPQEPTPAPSATAE